MSRVISKYLTLRDWKETFCMWSGDQLWLWMISCGNLPCAGKQANHWSPGLLILEGDFPSGVIKYKSLCELMTQGHSRPPRTDHVTASLCWQQESLVKNTTIVIQFHLNKSNSFLQGLVISLFYTFCVIFYIIAYKWFTSVWMCQCDPEFWLFTDSISSKDNQVWISSVHR